MESIISNPSHQWAGSALFLIAVLHTFSVKQFQALALKFPDGSVGENFFHLLGEVEVVFGFWAAILIAYLMWSVGEHATIEFVNHINFTEPVFVFVIMATAATKPVTDFARMIINGIARVIPLPKGVAFYLSALVLGPLLGSLITEPAAMTVTALILKDRFFDRGVSSKLAYATLGVLFVNVSIGGVLTPYAAPPVVMVAGKWGWDLSHMLMYFGWKSAIAASLNALVAGMIFRQEISHLDTGKPLPKTQLAPIWLIAIHLCFLFMIVQTAHYPVVFMGVFLFFLGVVTITKEYQTEIKLKESLLVGFFLGGLVVLGNFQSWWLKPLLNSLDVLPLFLGATALTAVTDNAALTFLGSQVEGLSELAKYALAAGAVTGGGLTVIANAPNPAGFTILRDSFGPEGISPLGLFLGALLPTLCALICFWVLPLHL